MGVQLNQIWEQDGSMDIKPLQEKINFLLAAAPDAYIHLLFRLVPPR